MKYRGFIFDLDGVLTDTSEYHFRAWQSLAESVGIPIDRSFNEALKGVSRKDSLERILVFGGQAAQFSDHEKQLLAEEKNQLYNEMIADISPQNLFEGVEDLLQQLKRQKIKIALGSASKNAQKVIQRLGIEGYFDHIVNAAAISHGKPAPDIFLDAAANLKLLPERCVGVEDSQVGIDAILAARMYAIGIGTSESLCRAHIVYPSVKDIIIDDLSSPTLALW